MYSAMKRRAKGPLPYSILNPETISDSPSAKSNGARFVSARLVINQMMVNGNTNMTGHVVWDINIDEKEKNLVGIKMVRRIRDILISYEMVWATLRSLPRREYLELDVHPAAKVG